MNTGAKFAKIIRQYGRKRLRRSRDLWQDYKILRGSWVRRAYKRLRFLIYLYPVFLLAAVTQDHGRDLPMVLLTLYSAATILTRSSMLWTALYRSGDLAFFMHLPVSDQKFFDYEFGKFLRSSIVIWFFAFVAFSYISVLAVSAPMIWFTALAAATLHWSLIISLILFLQWAAPRWAGLRLSVPLYALAFGAIFLPPPWLEVLKNTIVPLPTAWVPVIFERGLLGGQAASLWLLFPIVAIIAILPLMVTRLRKAYPRFDIVYPLMVGSFTAAGEEDEGLAEHSTQSDVVTGPKARRPDFRPAPVTLPAIDWNTLGWIERVAARCLGSVRRKQAEFLAGDQIGWSASWKLGLKIAGVGALLTLAVPYIPLWIPWSVGVIAFLCILPLAGGAWIGLQPHAAGGGRVTPVNAVAPLSFSQTSRIMITVNPLRMLTGLPFFLAYGLLLGWQTREPVAESFAISLRVFIVLLILQPYAILLRHSEGTNDSRVLKLRSIVTLLLLIFLAIGWLTCVFFFFALDARSLSELAFVLAAMVGLFAFSALSWLLYQNLYNRGRIDLLRTTDR